MEWERPDWRDPNQYPDPKTTPLKQWAWEFLRRNSEYQADYLRYATKQSLSEESALHDFIFCNEFREKVTQLGVNSKEFADYVKSSDIPETMDAVSIDPEAAHGESILHWAQRTGGIVTRWKLPLCTIGNKWFGREITGIPHPSINSVADCINFGFNTSPKIRIMHATLKDRYDLEEDVLIEKFLKDLSSKDLSSGFEIFHQLKNDSEYKKVTFKPRGLGEFFVGFDLSLPINKQLEAAKKVLEAQKKEYKEKGGMIFQARNAINKYQDYLRVLDADHAGESKKNIAKVLLPHVDNSLSNDYLGNKSVTNQLQAATLIRDEKYRYIVLGNPPK